MIAAGFKGLETEWWHFTLRDEPYPETFFDFPVEPRPCADERQRRLARREGGGQSSRMVASRHARPKPAARRHTHPYPAQLTFA